MEDMIEFNPDVPRLSTGELEKEMASAEVTAENDAWTAPIDEVFTQPDILRTAYLWQVKIQKDEWELEEDNDEEEAHDQWGCLPQHWQLLLNTRLSEYKSKVQDAEALYLHRVATFGHEDLKSKNAFQKFESLKGGEGASSVILINKANGKESSPDVYSKAISRSKSKVSVQCGPRVKAFRLNVADLTLTALEPEDAEGDEKCDVKQLRIISVTGSSREVQALRVHLDALSLCTKKEAGGAKEGHGGVDQDEKKAGACEKNEENLLLGAQNWWFYSFPSSYTAVCRLVLRLLQPKLNTGPYIIDIDKEKKYIFICTYLFVYIVWT